MKQKRRKAVKAKKVQKRRSPSSMSFLRRNIIVIFPVILFAIVILTLVNNRTGKYVLAASTNAFRNGTVTWQTVPYAVKYNIYYKNQSDTRYVHSVRGLPSSSTSYTINYLKKNTTYDYYVTALNGSGKEFWFSSIKSL